MIKPTYKEPKGKQRHKGRIVLMFEVNMCAESNNLRVFYDIALLYENNERSSKNNKTKF